MKDSVYLEFRLLPRLPGAKTNRWDIVSRHRKNVLGQVSWLSAWRQYVVVIYGDTIWNRQCLRDVTTFIDEAMAEWAGGRKIPGHSRTGTPRPEHLRA